MKIKLACPITKDSIVDGPGLRTVIWTQGCIHQCSGCHNPQTHDLTAGIEVDTLAIIEDIKQTRMQKGITLSGGEPLLQAKALIEVAKAAKQLKMDVWCYTGFTWEQLNNRQSEKYREAKELLMYVDVLVDGRFVEQLRCPTLKFRGSSNQRVIDVQQSIVAGEIMLVNQM